MNIELKNLTSGNEHEGVMKNITEYNDELELFFQQYTEYDDIEGITEAEFTLQQQEIFYTILGVTSALLFVYNELEQYEQSSELHTEMKRGFLMIYDRIFPDTNNEQKFYDLIDSMFATYKTIYK